MSELCGSAQPNYLPPRGDGSVIKGYSWRDELYTDENGLYYRELATAPTDLLDATALQIQVERGWKTPHFSLESAERFMGKLQEETVEFVEACVKYHAGKTTREHLIEEAGDAVWVWIANVSNVGVVLATAIDVAIPQVERAQGTPHDLRDLIDDGHAVEDEALLRAYRWANLAQCADELPPEGAARLLSSAAVMSSGVRAIWPTHGEAAPPAYTVSSFGTFYLGPLAVDSILQIGRLAKSEGIDTEAVLQALQTKVEGRIAANAVDRGDPGRPA